MRNIFFSVSAFSHTHSHAHAQAPCCFQSGLHVNEDGGTEVGSGLLWMLIREGLQIPADAPDMEDNGSACVAGAFSSKLPRPKPTALLSSTGSAGEPAGHNSSPNKDTQT